MTRETWKQFFERVKPVDDQQFKDIYGNDWLYNYGLFSLLPELEISISPRLTDEGNFITCSLLDAVDHVEKPKLKKVTLYAYLFMTAYYFNTDDNVGWPIAYDESGNRITKEIWVNDNE